MMRHAAGRWLWRYLPGRVGRDGRRARGRRRRGRRDLARPALIALAAAWTETVAYYTGDRWAARS